MIRDWIDLLLWLAAVAALIALASYLAHRYYRRFLRAHRGPHATALNRGEDTTALDLLLDPLEMANTGQHGLLSLLDNYDAFAARSLSAASAGRSLDLMYYIWHADITGWLLLDDLLAAADRGVRVRLLLDDVNVQGFDRMFLGISQHPMVEVRLFNPMLNRGRPLRRLVEFGLGLARFNRRMHGKLWIADGRAAIIGGRNIGDTYFGALDGGNRNSVDADVMLVGTKISEVSATFDSFWNLGLSLPIRALWPGFSMNMAAFRRRLARHVNTAASRKLRSRAIGGRDAAEVLTDRLRWCDKVQLIADPPTKAYGRKIGLWMSDQVDQILGAAQKNVQLVTPYFVPGAAGIAGLTDLAKRGVQVSVLTNALSASDMVLVHGAYRHYRMPLLSAGVILHEFAPPPGRRGKRDVLHSKVFLIDGEQAVVGSLNFDLRSAFMNTELGLLFEEPVILAELRAMFAHHCAPKRSYTLQLDQNRLRWLVARPGLPKVMKVEPEATWAWRAISWCVGRLPVQSYL